MLSRDERRRQTRTWEVCERQQGVVWWWCGRIWDGSVGRLAEARLELPRLRQVGVVNVDKIFVLRILQIRRGLPLHACESALAV